MRETALRPRLPAPELQRNPTPERTTGATRVDREAGEVKGEVEAYDNRSRLPGEPPKDRIHELGSREKLQSMLLRVVRERCEARGIAFGKVVGVEESLFRAPQRPPLPDAM